MTAVRTTFSAAGWVEEAGIFSPFSVAKYRQQATLHRYRGRQRLGQCPEMLAGKYRRQAASSLKNRISISKARWEIKADFMPFFTSSTTLLKLTSKSRLCRVINGDACATQWRRCSIEKGGLLLVSTYYMPCFQHLTTSCQGEVTKVKVI